jgi:demethylmenaquinone methyltransferase / 2-methoxy-6-polyprenyl-1,4-benzoquinol methylase
LDNNTRYKAVREASEEERISMVKEIFSTITGRYDFLNHFLSLRRDVAWRRFASRRMRFKTTERFLDIATGTADLAIAAARKHRHISVVGVDFVKAMVDLGRTKLEVKGLSKRISLMQGDALHLPFKDNSFDVTGIAFGIRNIPDRFHAIKEMTRVTVPGGQVLVLEMAFTRNWFSMLLYNTYLNRILPHVAKRFSFNPKAYYYLADSIMNFPSKDEFVGLMKSAGLETVNVHKLTFGTTYLYEAVKGK